MLRAPIVVAPIILRSALVAAVLLAGLALLVGLAGDAGHRGLLAHAGITRRISLAIIVIAKVARRAHPVAVSVGHLAAALLSLLLAVGDDHAVVVLGVLEIILGQHGVAGCLSVTRQSHVFTGDIGSGATDFHVRTVGLEAAG